MTDPHSDLPRISVITPSLNQGQFIQDTIRSVLSQGYPNLEYLVIDGGSTDHTLDVLQRYSGQLAWVSEKDKGQTEAINKGLRMANGDILAYLNADDLFLPGTLFKVAQVFVQQPETMWLTGRCRIIDEANQETRWLITVYKNMLLRLHHPALLSITDYISQPATFWRAGLLESLGYFDESFRFAMDYEYFLRLNTRYRPAILHEYLSAFRVHRQSKNTNAGHSSAYVVEDRLAVERHTRSRTLLRLHDLHRWLMTTLYSLMNG